MTPRSRLKSIFFKSGEVKFSPSRRRQITLGRVTPTVPRIVN